MARRRKAPRRRSPKTISALNVLESYTYATILAKGLTNNSPLGLITGKTDLTGAMVGYDDGIFGNESYVGGDSLSLGDMINAPTAALNIVQSNFMGNYQSMIIQSAVTRIGYKFAKRALRAPIANVNRTIMKPLGLGVRI